jgi:hypothetical protein
MIRIRRMTSRVGMMNLLTRSIPLRRPLSRMIAHSKITVPVMSSWRSKEVNRNPSSGGRIVEGSMVAPKALMTWMMMK